MRVSIPTSRRPGGRRLGALAGGVLLAAFAAMPVAHAIAASGAEPAHGSPPLLDPVTTTLPGKRVGLNVCEFTSTLTVRRGQPPVREDVVAVDDATCTATVQRGTPAVLGPDGDGPADPAETVANGRGTPAANAVATRSRRAKARAAATIHSAGYHKSYFEDPPGIDVNSVRNDVDWRWNGVRVSDGFCEWHHGWFAGWERREHNFFCRYENEQRQLRSSSFVHYRNGIFCLTIDAHTWYERNNAYGRRNGDLVGTVNWRKEGGCVGLLSFHHFLRRTLN
jgi:hypothetical protein